MVSIFSSITSQYAVIFFILPVNPFHLTETGVVNNKQTGIQNNEILQSCKSEKNPKCATKSAPSVHQTDVVLLTHSETKIAHTHVIAMIRQLRHRPQYSSVQLCPTCNTLSVQ